MKYWINKVLWILQIAAGCAIFAVGFNLFLAPHHFNGGGLTGLAQILTGLTGVGSVAVWVAAMNVPLFAIAGTRIGKKFFIGSLLGISFIALFLELFSGLPSLPTEPLLASVYGGVCAGAGLGVVFLTGASTGGADIIVRLIKLKWRNLPIGTLTMGFDVVIMILTGVAFGDMSVALYTGITVFLSGKVLDVVVYSFDYSEVVMIITQEHEAVACGIQTKLERGVTYLNGEGAYSGQEKKVVLTATKKHQLAELKEMVVSIDPKAFIIVQEAHQVLGDGFAHYSKDSL